MKTKQTFWGALLITLGGLFLLNSLLNFGFAWSFLWKLWPLVLIIWGISALTPNIVVKHVLSVAKAVLLAIVIFAGFKSVFNSWDQIDWDDDDDGVTHFERQTFCAPFEKNTETANFIFKAGAGKFTIKDTTGDLLYSEIKSSINDFQFESDTETNTVKLFMQEHNHHFKSFSPKNFAEIRMNPIPKWDIDINIGAASGDFDFSNYKVKNLTMNAGAAKINIKLGSLIEESNVTIKTGVSKINVAVPNSVGCEIHSKTGLASKNYSGFREIGSNKYRTDNFDSSDKKIYLSIDAGVSSINVNRY
jgi:hypothetical protein